MKTISIITAVVLATLVVSFHAYSVETSKAPTGVAVDSKGNIYFTSGFEVKVHNPDMKFIKEFHLLSAKSYIPDTRLAIDDKDNVVAVDDNTIYIFTSSGASSHFKREEPCKFGGVTTDSKGRILIANSAAESVEIYSPKGKLLNTFSKKTVVEKHDEKEVEKEIGKPLDVFLREDRIYVTHEGGVTTWKYDVENVKALYEEFIGISGSCVASVVDSKGRLYTIVGGDKSADDVAVVEVRELDDNGKWQKTATYDGDPYRLLKNPNDLAINSKDDILIADTGNDRILIENAETFRSQKDNYPTWKETFDAELPRIDNITQVSAKISWKTKELMRSGVMFNPIVERGVAKSQYVMTKEGIEHSVTLEKLEPGKRYKLFCAPFGRNIPHFKGSRYWTFATRPPEDKTAYIKLPVIALIFKNIIEVPEGIDVKDIPRTQTPDKEMERIRRELDMAELFYWVNSGLRLCIEIETLVIDDFYFEPPLGDYFYPDEEGHKKIKQIMKDKNITSTQYDGVVILNCVRRYDPETKELIYDTGTESGTMRASPPIEDLSSWSGFSDNTWFFIREFGRQIDVKFKHSGIPEYPSNDSPVDGDYGKDYDIIASRLRMWGDRWLRMSFGQLVVTDDKDNDSVPDDDASVPLDEKRFESDPAKKDTDDDGLSDYDEIMTRKREWEGRKDVGAD